MTHIPDMSHIPHVTDAQEIRRGSCWNQGQPIDHFTVVCLVAWPLNENEAGGDLVLIETSLLFICKFLLISTRAALLT